LIPYLFPKALREKTTIYKGSYELGTRRKRNQRRQKSGGVRYC
jgi:hypothetical protein